MTILPKAVIDIIILNGSSEPKAVKNSGYYSPLFKSAKIRELTLALAYLSTFEPMKISPALDNRIVLNFIRNL
jgi:hypothetical protein